MEDVINLLFSLKLQ